MSFASVIDPTLRVHSTLVWRGRTYGDAIAGFEDPFDPVTTVTLDNPAYRYFGYSLMKGKLDWLLLRKMKVLEKDVGNHDYSASDHKWLSANVELC